MTTEEKEEGIVPWLKYKINYGLTYKGMKILKGRKDVKEFPE